MKFLLQPANKKLSSILQHYSSQHVLRAGLFLNSVLFITSLTAIW